MSQTSTYKLSLEDFFEELPDPRIDRHKQHKLTDIVVISICAVICGMKSWIDIADFGESREEWFSKFLELPNGIPSHDTFRRVFGLIEPNKFQECFNNWLLALCSVSGEDVVAIDGKTLRRSLDKVKGISALHLVSAWSCNRSMVLGQVAVDEKSNEIVAIPKLLEILSARGCIFTIDAMGCQKEIAGQITEKKGDYVFCLKENHPNLHEEAVKFFENPSNAEHIDSIESTEADHGRIETRKCQTASANLFYKTENWPGIASVGMIESTREINGKISKEKRYYISSLESNAKRISSAIRSHWQIENSLHWTLDVTFDEDQCRIRDEKAAENFAILRRMAVGLLKNETSTKKSLRRKVNRALTDPNYLLTVLAANKSKTE